MKQISSILPGHGKHGSVGTEVLGVLKLDTAAPVVGKLLETNGMKYPGCKTYI